MNAGQRRYREGLEAAAAWRARAAGAVPEPGVGMAHPLTGDVWERIAAGAEANRGPGDAAERRAFESHGVFDLAPEGRDGCRLRLRAPGGRLRAWQLRELAAVSQEFGGGFVEIGERGEVELPVVPWREAAAALTRARAAGLTGRGSGGGGIRNVVAGPTTGLDPEEVLDAGPWVAALDAVATECRGLAESGSGWRAGFDGGGRGWPGAVGQDAVFRAESAGAFRLEIAVGGTLTDVCVRVPAGRAARTAAALARVSAVAARQRTAEEWLGELEAALGERLPRVPRAGVATARALAPGVHAQKEAGRNWLAAGGPGDGRWRSRQLLALAAVAEAEGAGEVRVVLAFSPVGLLVPGVADGRAEGAARALADAGFSMEAAGACGNAAGVT